MEAKNVPGRILTTDYLLFSEPAALDALAGLNNLEVRMFRTSGVGFHTKGYLFHNGNDIRIIVGSSNLTQNAITRNFEWNTRVVSTSDGQYAKDIEAEFNCVCGKVRWTTIHAEMNMQGSIRKRSLKRPR